MISHVINACAELLPQHMLVVISPNADALTKTIEPNKYVVQPKPLGTGDAVKAAEKALGNFEGDIMVAFGDTPLLTTKTLQQLRDRKAETNAAIVVSGFTPTDAAGYGRLIVNKNGQIDEIIELKDATVEQRSLTLCNGGVMLFSAGKLWPLLAQLSNKNAKGEYYLTDTIALARNASDASVVAHVAEDDVLGINTRVELAAAEKLMQRRLRETAMLAGVTMLNPETVFLSSDTRLGCDVTIGPNVVFGPGVEIGDRVDIRAFCHFEQVRVEHGAIIGPFARLRPGSVIGSGAHIGNFVEIKNAEIGAGAKINHLSYIGDAFVGNKANIGAGTITCNYDGFRKFHTHVGAGAFIGSNSSLVAPVKIGDGAYIGAGSVITSEVPEKTLAIARGRQSNIPGWAERFRSEGK